MSKAQAVGHAPGPSPFVNSCLLKPWSPRREFVCAGSVLVPCCYVLYACLTALLRTATLPAEMPPQRWPLRVQNSCCLGMLGVAHSRAVSGLAARCQAVSCRVTCLFRAYTGWDPSLPKSGDGLLWRARSYAPAPASGSWLA